MVEEEFKDVHGSYNPAFKRMLNVAK